MLRSVTTAWRLVSLTLSVIPSTPGAARAAAFPETGRSASALPSMTRAGGTERARGDPLELVVLLWHDVGPDRGTKKARGRTFRFSKVLTLPSEKTGRKRSGRDESRSALWFQLVATKPELMCGLDSRSSRRPFRRLGSSSYRAAFSIG
jgi:hypothetical protein